MDTTFVRKVGDSELYDVNLKQLGMQLPNIDDSSQIQRQN